MKRRHLLALGALAWPMAARAQNAPPPPAILRPHALLEGEVLRLSDLFDQAGPQAGRVIAASPQPGRRMVLETQNLINIARQNGVNWRPLTGTERIVIERPGRTVPRSEIEALLRDELARHGIEPEMEIELPGLIPPMIPAQSWFQLALEGVTVEQPGARFQATLVVLADGAGTQRMRLAGRAVVTVPVVVATRRLALGEVIGPHDARLTRLRDLLRRPMAADQDFALVDLGPPSIVQKNALVTLQLEAGGISLTAQGRALESAARGATVPVMNLASRNIVEGVAIAPGRVRVAMGAIPVAAR